MRSRTESHRSPPRPTQAGQTVDARYGETARQKPGDERDEGEGLSMGPSAEPREDVGRAVGNRTWDLAMKLLRCGRRRAKPADSAS